MRRLWIIWMNHLDDLKTIYTQIYKINISIYYLQGVTDVSQEYSSELHRRGGRRVDVGDGRGQHASDSGIEMVASDMQNEIEPIL